MCLASWALGARAGFVTGTAAAVLTILQEGRPGPLQPEGAMSRDLTAIWNAGMRVLVVAVVVMLVAGFRRSEEHTSELQSLMRISYAVFCLKKKTRRQNDSWISCKLQNYTIV